MAAGAPFHGYFIAAWQPFVAQSNTITYLGATVGNPTLPAGGPVGYNLRIRLCAGIANTSNGECSGVLADQSPQIINYGNTAADVGDIAVTPGATYWVVWYQPPAAGTTTWVTYWWAGGASITTSDQMQAVVKGYNR